MKKKETTILLDKKQNYQITVYGRQLMSIQPRPKYGEIPHNINITNPGNISFKAL